MTNVYSQRDAEQNSLTPERAQKRTRSADVSRSPTPERRRLEYPLQNEELPMRQNESSHRRYESTSSQPKYSTYDHRKDESGDSYQRQRSPTPSTQRREAQTLYQDCGRSSSMVTRPSRGEEFPEGNPARLARRSREDSINLRHRYRDDSPRRQESSLQIGEDFVTASGIG